VLIRYGRRVTFLDDELTRMTSVEGGLPAGEADGDWFYAISPPTFFFFYEEPPDVGAGLTALLNDGLAAAVRAQPRHLVAMAALPMQDARRAVVEMERARNELGMRAVYVGSNVNGRGLDAVEFWPVYEAAEALGMPIFIHPRSSDLAGADRMQDYFIINLVGNPVDTTLAAARLVLGGVLERFPGLQVCLAHGGGYLALAAGRIGRGYKVHPACRHAVSRAPGELLQRFYVDTIVHAPAALAYLVDFFGADHVLCGSDYPFQIGDTDPIATIRSVPGLSATEQRLILCDNAARLLALGPAMTTSGAD
jgi:aminocarboxymuconate-semialdehyde decarboxylase